MEDSIFADRIMDVPKSFIREILKVTMDHSIISSRAVCPTASFFQWKRLKRPPSRF